MTYKWISEYLKRYGRGHIIVNANSVEEAREKALNAFEAHDMEENSHNYLLETDEFDKEEISLRKQTFLSDISVEPEMIEVSFILGSE